MSKIKQAKNRCKQLGFIVAVHANLCYKTKLLRKFMQMCATVGSSNIAGVRRCAVQWKKNN